MERNLFYGHTNYRTPPWLLQDEDDDRDEDDDDDRDEDDDGIAS